MSIAVVGMTAFIDYVQFLLNYVSLTKEGFRTFKYVDIASFVRLLSGTESKIPSYVGLFGVVTAIAALTPQWNRATGGDQRQIRMLWSNAIAWTMIMNVYVGIYELAMFLIPIIHLIDDHGMLSRERAEDDGTARFPYQLRLQLLTLYASCWLSQFIALATRIQILTPVLFWLALTQFRLNANRVPRQQEHL